MRISTDTNLLVRVAVSDNLQQTVLAETELANAELVAVPMAALCEFVWVLRRSYRRSALSVAESLRKLINSPNVVTDRAAVEAGLAFLDAGGDFADGVIAFQGQMLGGQTFVSFDQDAVALVAAQGSPAKLLA